MNTEIVEVRHLLTPEAIRERCQLIFNAAEKDQLHHFKLDLDKLDDCADFVIEVMRENYPDLEVPFHSRWRHFVVDGDDRWAKLSSALTCDPLEKCRMRIELAVTSVLLDAGAGPVWKYTCDNGAVLERSEGLAIASLDAFKAGLFSGDDSNPLRVDADTLSKLKVRDIEAAFQVSADNELAGAEGRAELLNRLGIAFTSWRVGDLADKLIARANDGALPAREILIEVLNALGSIWPSRIQLAEFSLGDTWHHSAIPENHLVPFHKLSQWLSYSLIEPLEEFGIKVVDLDALTGLAEYRNGGLFVDCGVLIPKENSITTSAHAPDSEVIVEWRALTIILLDRVATNIRMKLGEDNKTLPLASILEGGTWAAGRKIASQLRNEGGPPIQIISDGSVF